MVKVYSTPTCAYCVTLKEYLKSRNIQFEDNDVSKDQQAAQDMIAKSGQMGVPVVDIDGQIIVGFDEAAIKELLKL